MNGFSTTRAALLSSVALIAFSSASADARYLNSNAGNGGGVRMLTCQREPVDKLRVTSQHNQQALDDYNADNAEIADKTNHNAIARDSAGSNSEMHVDAGTEVVDEASPGCQTIPPRVFHAFEWFAPKPYATLESEIGSVDGGTYVPPNPGSHPTVLEQDLGAQHNTGSLRGGPGVPYLAWRSRVLDPVTNNAGPWGAVNFYSPEKTPPKQVDWLFEWAEVPGAATYEVRWSLHDCWLPDVTFYFSGCPYSTERTSLPRLKKEMWAVQTPVKIYWRVYAKNASGLIVAWSETNTMPSNPRFSRQMTDRSVSWQPAPGAASYTVYLSSSPDFSLHSGPPAGLSSFKGLILKRTNISATTFRFENISKNRAYHWKVDANAPDGSIISTRGPYKLRPNVLSH